jgi:hypothetical protein
MPLRGDGVTRPQSEGRRWAALWRLFACCLALWLAGAVACRGAEPEADPAAATAAGPSAGPTGIDAASRAAFLFNFLTYIEWPSAAFGLADDPYVIGVMHADGVFAELLLSTTGRSVAGRPVTVKQIQEGDSLQGLHLLYIGPTPPDRLAAILAGVDERWTVPVTDGENGLAQGGAIHFLDVAGRLRFEVSLAAIRRGDYRLSSRMLRVARIKKGES